MTRGGRTRNCPYRILKEYYDYVARAEFLLERGYVTHTTLRELIEKLQKLDLDKKESKK